MLKTAALSEEIRRVTIDGRDFDLDVARNKLLPVVRGGEGPNDPPTDPPADPPPSDPPPADPPADPPTAKTFTQAEVDREKVAAERSAKKQFDDWLVAQKAEQDKSAMDDVTRAKTEAAEEKAEAARERAEAKRERLDAKVERRLAAAGVGAGMKEEDAARALSRAVGLVTLELDADDAAITAELEALKKDVPGLFVAADPGTGTPPPSGVPVGGPPGSPPGQPTGMAAIREKHRKEREGKGETQDVLATIRPKSA